MDTRCWNWTEAESEAETLIDLNWPFFYLSEFLKERIIILKDGFDTSALNQHHNLCGRLTPSWELLLLRRSALNPTSVFRRGTLRELGNVRAMNSPIAVESIRLKSRISTRWFVVSHWSIDKRSLGGHKPPAATVFANLLSNIPSEEYAVNKNAGHGKYNIHAYCRSVWLLAHIFNTQAPKKQQHSPDPETLQPGWNAVCISHNTHSYLNSLSLHDSLPFCAGISTSTVTWLLWIQPKRSEKLSVLASASYWWSKWCSASTRCAPPTKHLLWPPAHDTSKRPR